MQTATNTSQAVMARQGCSALHRAIRTVAIGLACAVPAVPDMSGFPPLTEMDLLLCWAEGCQRGGRGESGFVPDLDQGPTP
ncbi:hypothetical protein Aglo01_21890 [Actinokineospora globicatena]|uniref:Uncharacterized protein n=1 Tax=Actinokineospora globicatena TaxID=103729 RepID=A0A9W6VDK4_9PSEU|nr:hypothetical protein Aglo01_21890 [Actinokineospora globicatena]GLW95088.1 hypothetical protein Aglo03_59040 [Actinokineospora globicatena]